MPIASVRKKNYNGITTKTVENLQLGAGAWFKNVSRTESYAEAKAAGKCIGATRGGGTFRAQAQIQQVEIDGAPGRVKGGIIITGWEVSMQTTLIESSTNALKMALGASDVDTTTMPGYDIIKGRMYADDADFVNLCWMGCIAGTTEPIKIFISNSFSEGGLEYATSDDGTGTIPLQLYGYNGLDEFMNDTVAPPFEIVRKQQESSSIPVVYAQGGDEMVMLSWGAIPGATKYSVKSYASDEYTTIINDLTATWYAITDLTADTAYTYLVQAYVNGAWSPAESATYNVTVRTNPAST